MGGAAGLAGLLQGMAAGQQQNRQMELEEGYKKAVIAKTKNELDLGQMQLHAMMNPYDPTSALILGKDPLKMAMAQILANGLQGQKSQVAPAMQTENAPAQQGGPTFPGTVTMGVESPFANLSPEMKGAINKETGMFDWTKVTGAREGTIQGQPGIIFYGPGGPVSFQPTTPEVVWKEGQPINGVRQEYPLTKTGQPYPNLAPRPLATEINYKEIEGAGGEKSLVPVQKYINAGPQAPAPTGKLNLTLDTTQPGWQDQAKRAIDQFGTAPVQGAGPVTPPRNGPQGIQLSPAKGDLPISPEDEKNYINPLQPQALIPKVNGRNISYNQAAQYGIVPVDAETRKRITAMSTTDAQINLIQRGLTRAFGDVQTIMSQNPSWLEERMGAGKRMAGAYLKLPNSEKVQTLFKFLDAARGPLVRTLGGESGNLSDGDVQRAGGWIPEKSDSLRVMWQKTFLLKEFKDDIQQSYAKGQYDPNGNGSTLVNAKWDRLNSLGYQGPNFYNVGGKKTWIDTGNKYLQLWETFGSK